MFRNTAPHGALLRWRCETSGKVAAAHWWPWHSGRPGTAVVKSRQALLITEKQLLELRQASCTKNDPKEVFCKILLPSARHLEEPPMSKSSLLNIVIVESRVLYTNMQHIDVHTRRELGKRPGNWLVFAQPN